MAQEPIKVFFATDGIFPLSVGGIQRYSKLIVEELAHHQEVELTVLHPHEGKKLFPDNIKEVTIADIDTNKNYLKELYQYSKRVYEKIKEENYDVIYAQGFTVWYKMEEFKGKLINNPHGLESFQALDLKSKLIGIPFRKVQRKIFKNATIVCSEGGHLTTILNSIVGPEKVEFVPNATNLPEETYCKPKPDANQPITLFFIARFAHNKGIHILMQAVKELNEEGFEDKLQFNLGGKGPLYEEYIEKYKMKNVRFLGFVPDEDLAHHYRDSDVFCFPTLFEGMPTVVLEAMSNYLPVIVSDTGATSELVNEGNGFLLTPGDVQQLKDSIVKFLQLRAEEKNKMSQVSFERLRDNFTWEAVAQKHLTLFKTINSRN